MEQSNISILTNRGKALEAASAAGGDPVVLAEFVVGDGNGQPVTPDAGQTALVREVYRGTISRLAVSPEQENQFIAYLSLPEGVGGFVIREVGLLTNKNELYAAGSCAAIEKPEKGVTATLEFRMAVSESAQITLQTATGEGLFLRQNMNLADVVDKDEATENLGLKPTKEKAENAVQRSGDTMTGKLTLPQTSAFGVNTDNALGGNSIALGESGTGIKQDGEGILAIYANSQQVIRINNAGLGSNKPINVTGRVTPSDYGNFDERYQSKVSGFQNIRLGLVSASPTATSRTTDVPTGCVMTGVTMDVWGSRGTHVTQMRYRPLQILINGTWTTVSQI